MSCFTDIENKPDDWLVLDPLTIQKPIPKTGCDTNLIVQNYLSEFKTDAQKQKVKDNLGLYVDNILSKNSTNPIANKTVYEAFSKFTGSNNITKVTWDANSNMNDFKTSGVYDIYGERTRQDDNLPILNASSGHSIAARLTVVASTLQPANNEICVTQFLMLSNRKGGDGNMYVRTYNENNSPAADWWTPWQKLQGIREGYIFTDTIQVNPDGGVQQIDGVTGLNNMIDNGIYSGIYIDDPTFTSPTFIDTFTLIVINNYAVVSKDSRLKRTISQLKYAVDAITNQASVKKRTKTDDDKWSDWEDIGAGEISHTIIAEIKSKAVKSDSFEVEALSDGINIDYSTIDNNGGSIEIPNATEKYAGVMSATDKVELEETRNFLDRLMTGLGTSDVTVVADRILAVVNPAFVNVEPETPIEE